MYVVITLSIPNDKLLQNCGQQLSQTNITAEFESYISFNSAICHLRNPRISLALGVDLTVEIEY